MQTVLHSNDLVTATPASDTTTLTTATSNDTTTLPTGTDTAQPIRIATSTADTTLPNSTDTTTSTTVVSTPQSGSPLSDCPIHLNEPTPDMVIYLLFSVIHKIIDTDIDTNTDTNTDTLIDTYKRRFKYLNYINAYINIIIDAYIYADTRFDRHVYILKSTHTSPLTLLLLPPTLDKSANDHVDYNNRQRRLHSVGLRWYLGHRVLQSGRRGYISTSPQHRRSQLVRLIHIARAHLYLI